MSETSNQNSANDWVILKAEKEGMVSLCRLRKTRPPVGLSTLVTIAWSYSDPDHNGFPGHALREDMDRFEDAVTPIIDKREFSWLALVITGMGLKEWSFYVQEPKAFIAELSELMRDKPFVPIDIFHSEDPDCQYWARYREHAG